MDEDHTGDHLCCSHTKNIIFIKSSPIVWHSKSQANMESSTFGSRFVVLRTQYKILMLGVNMIVSAFMSGYNMSVVNGVSIPQ